MLYGPNCGWLDVTCDAAGLPGEELVSSCDFAFSLSAGHSKDLQGSVNMRMVSGVSCSYFKCFADPRRNVERAYCVCGSLTGSSGSPVQGTSPSSS